MDAGSNLETKKSSAPNARLLWLRIIREYTTAAAAAVAAVVGHRRGGLGCLVEKKYHVKRLGTALRGQTRVSQRKVGCLSPGPSEAHSARRQT